MLVALLGKRDVMKRGCRDNKKNKTEKGKIISISFISLYPALTELLL